MEQKPKIEFVEDVEPQEVGNGDVLLVDAAGEIQRLPVPSNDPNDPLNFTAWEKTGVIVSCCWFCKGIDFFFGLYRCGCILTATSDHVSLYCWRPRCHSFYLRRNVWRRRRERN